MVGDFQILKQKNNLKSEIFYLQFKINKNKDSLIWSDIMIFNVMIMKPIMITTTIITIIITIKEWPK